jgi:2-polyprenyl-6-methoxyphenol hydroxylase-like FAD-dependent oxidoreductase
MIEHDVVVAGAGPTGLMLAGELALAGTDVVVVERRRQHDLVGSRAGGMTSRTLEVLDQRGIVDRFLDQGFTGQNGHYSGLFFDVSDLPTRHNYGLGLLQYRVERTLADWIVELGVPIRHGHNITGFTQDDTGATVTVADGAHLRARYLIGCDGGRSLIRKTAAIPFPGWEASLSCLVADVDLSHEPPWGLHREPSFHSFFKFEGTESVRVMVTEPELGNVGAPGLDDIREALIAARGTDYGLRAANWVSRFTDTTRQAATYRDRRVLLAGDAAHVHFPIGGQGLNTGVQDSVNLGWKLAQVVDGTSPESLLDTYHDERHPVAAQVLHNTMAQTALNAPGARVDALRDTMTELLAMDQPRMQIAATMCGLDIHHDLGAGHPLVGRRVPDLDLQTTAGSPRIFDLLHRAQPVLLNLATPGRFINIAGYDRLSVVDARYTGPCHLPVIGQVPHPHAVLIRPDGHVAWVDTGGSATGLDQALTKWIGTPQGNQIATR